MSQTLGSVVLPDGLVWVDEFDWAPVERAVEYSTTGSLLVDVGTRAAGRPITLQADANAGWRGMTRTKVQSLQSLAADAQATHRLTLADSRAFTVMFAPDNPVAARPVGRPELPGADHPYIVTLRLLALDEDPDPVP